MPDLIFHEPTRLSYDLRAVTRTLGDAKARTVFETALDRYETLRKRADDLHVEIYCEAARADLEAAGFKISDETFRNGCLLHKEFDIGEIDRLVGIWLYRDISAAVHPEIVRLRSLVIAAFEKALAKLEAAENDALALFPGQPCEPALTSQALRHVLKALRELQAQPTDLSYHFNPRAVLNGWFPANEPLAEPAKAAA